MTRTPFFKFFALSVLIGLLSGCATAMVTGAVVSTAATATKVAVTTTVGAGELAYKGTKAVVKGAANVVTDDDEDDLPAY